MTSAPRLCPKCGAEISADSPEGGCPGCLFEAGLGLLSDTRAAADDSAESVEANAAAAAPKKAARAAEIHGELGDYELLEEVGRGGQGSFAPGKRVSTA
jgi:hypothetical protein